MFLAAVKNFHNHNFQCVGGTRVMSFSCELGQTDSCVGCLIRHDMQPRLNFTELGTS